MKTVIDIDDIQDQPKDNAIHNENSSQSLSSNYSTHYDHFLFEELV